MRSKQNTQQKHIILCENHKQGYIRFDHHLTVAWKENIGELRLQRGIMLGKNPFTKGQ